MSDLNKVCLTGRLTRNAEMKQVNDDSGTMTAFSIAVNRQRKKKNSDEYESVPSFINLALFGKRAESLFPYLVKGQLVSIEGHLEQVSWDKDGDHYSRLDVKIDRLNLIGSPAGKREAAVTEADQTEQTAFDKSTPEIF